MRLLLSRVALVASLLVPVSALAQGAAGWRAFPAWNEVTALASSGDAVWAGTNAGVYAYTPASGEVRRFTPVDGLRGGPLLSMDFDRARGVLWVGYGDGGLDRLDAATGAVTRIEDIARASQFSSRGIRRIRVTGDSLYLSTDFGVVVFDAVRAQVRNTYSRFAGLNPATPANDALPAPLPDGRPGVWVATTAGLVSAPADADLQTAGAWSVAPGFAFPSFSLAFFQGRIHVGGGPAGTLDVYRRTDAGTWERTLFDNLATTHLQTDGDRLFAISRFRLTVVTTGVGVGFYSSSDVLSLTGVARTDDGGLWVADGALGVFPVDPDLPTGPSTFVVNPITPTGPATNLIADLDVGPDGTLWVSTQRLAQGTWSAIGRFDGTAWTNYRSDDPALSISREAYRSAAVGPDGRFYAGSVGLLGSDDDGLTVVDDDGPFLYNETNSTLVGAASVQGGTAVGYVITDGVAFEGDRVWVLNSESPLPMHLLAADGTWTGLPAPPELVGVTRIVQLVVDGFGQKWLDMGTNGLGVWDTGADPASPADDRARRYAGVGGLGQGLPDATVRAVAVDGAGRVWVGTERGIAYIFSPGAAFGGDASLATPQWPIVVGADGDDEADYLLRDVRVTDMATDPAGRVWVATTSGAYLLNAEGNDIDRAITSADSPLPTDTIDRIAVDPVSGRVYLATSFGLFSAPGDATVARPASTALAVGPSPFRPALHADGVLVSGLNAARSQVRILTVDGEVVHAREARGGSFRWDGRDDRTGEPVASGVYIVAAASDTGETIYGRVAVIR